MKYKNLKRNCFIEIVKWQVFKIPGLQYRKSEV
jgi:hypothetical protein